MNPPDTIPTEAMRVPTPRGIVRKELRRQYLNAYVVNVGLLLLILCVGFAGLIDPATSAPESAVADVWGLLVFRAYCLACVLASTIALLGMYQLRKGMEAAGMFLCAGVCAWAAIADRVSHEEPLLGTIGVLLMGFLIAWRAQYLTRLVLKSHG